MKGNKPFLVILISLLVLMIFSVAMVFLTSSTPENPTKFTVWRPKPMNYKGGLVEKWSVPLTDVNKYSPSFFARKNGWHVNESHQFDLTDYSRITGFFGSGYGLDDVNSSRSIEFDYHGLKYMESAFSTKYSIEDCSSFITDNNYIYYCGEWDFKATKIDINTNKIVWEYKFPEGFLSASPPMYFVKDKLVLNTDVWNKDMEASSATHSVVILVDINTGKGQVLNIPGNVISTVHNDELYLIIDDVKVSKFDVEKMTLTGKMFDIRDYFKKGEHYWNYSHYWFTFASDGEHPDLLLNPNTMELCKLDADICTYSNLLYDNYWLCWIHRGDKIIGIDTETFEETWIIPADKLSKKAIVFSGDDRGILIQDGDKLICFNRP